MERLFWICLAGAAGTGTRYLVAVWAAQRFGTAFPYGTLVVNLASSRAAIRDGMATLTPLASQVIAELSGLDA